MARTDHQLKPSREARSLYSQMVARADQTGHIGLEPTVKLGAERVNKGNDVRVDGELVKELCREHWLAPANDGGWTIQGFSLST